MPALEAWSRPSSRSHTGGEEDAHPVGAHGAEGSVRAARPSKRRADVCEGTRRVQPLNLPLGPRPSARPLLSLERERAHPSLERERAHPSLERGRALRPLLPARGRGRERQRERRRRRAR
eukprot:scaffold48193_cov38-Tisochrysis_lutea.AAC.3